MANLRWKAIRRHRPFIATFELTYRCNLRCKHCYITKNDPYEEEMPVGEWIRAIRELKELGAILIVLTGGEPTLYPGFWDIIEELNTQNILIRIFTNATTLTEKDIDRLIQKGVRYFDISLHGPDAITHEEVTRVPGSFHKTVEVINRLKSAGIYMNLKGSLLKCNYSTANELHRFMQSLRGYPLINPSITPDNKGGVEPLQYALDAEGFHRVFQRYYYTDYEQEDSLEGRIPLAISCTAGLSTLTIVPNGEVFPCLQFRYPTGNVRRQTLKRIWYHAPLYTYMYGLMALRKAECKGCDLINYCLFCPGLAYLETGSLWKPYQSACQAARNYYEAYMHYLKERGRGHEQEELHPTQSR
jgi:radical SAM protein with 4Fe4S-binding SPASM domain